MISADLLSAAAIVAGVIGSALSIWWPSLLRSLDAPIPSNGLDAFRGALRRDQLSRALPFAALTLTVMAALAPPAIDIVKSVRVGAEYDPVGACFVIVWLALAGFFGSAIWAIVQLERKRRGASG